MLWREAPPPIPDHWFLSPPHSPGWWAPSRLCLYSFPAQTPRCIISTPLHPLSQHPCPYSLADQQAWHPFSFYIFLLKPGIQVMLNKSQITTPLWWPPTLAAPSSLLSKAALVPQPFVSLDSLHTVLAPSDTLVSGGVRCLISRREWWPLTGTPPLPLSTLSLSTHPNSIPSSSSPHLSNKKSLLLSEVNFSFFSSLPISALSPCYANLPKVSRKISLSQKSDSIAFLFRIGQRSTLTLGQSPRPFRGTQGLHRGPLWVAPSLTVCAPMCLLRRTQEMLGIPYSLCCDRTSTAVIITAEPHVWQQKP